MKNTIIMWTMMVLLSLLTACGGSDSSDGSNFSKSDDATTDATEEVIEETASTVVTSSADVNGFSIATTTLNPRAYDFIGTEVDLVATVKDHSNNPVADGTVVTFIADDNGYVEDQCTTTSGTCTVKWRSARDRNQPVDPDAGSDSGYANDYKITVMARTIGEDSFIDKNANSLFDDGETYFTQSEAFLDANDDGDYDSGKTDYDEYSDFNNNGSFDGNEAVSVFRGKSCSSSAKALGHCATQLEVWDTLTMINSSGGTVYISLTDCDGTELAYVRNDGTDSVTTLNLAGSSVYCLEVTDNNGNIPPTGTGIEVKTDNGSIDVSPTTVPNMYVQPGSGFIGQIRIKSDDTPSSGTMTIKTSSVDGQDLYLYIPVND
jgi:hypothetical protein